MAITTGDAVPGEVIQAAWGDAVRADLLAHDTGKVGTAGNWTMAGQLLLGSDPTAGPGILLNPTLGRVHTQVNTGQTANVLLNRGSSANSPDSGSIFVQFQRINATIGTITVGANLTSVLYNTTSDYRLKDVIGDIEDPLEVIARLQPRRLAWSSLPSA